MRGTMSTHRTYTENTFPSTLDFNGFEDGILLVITQTQKKKTGNTWQVFLYVLSQCAM